MPGLFAVPATDVSTRIDGTIFCNDSNVTAPNRKMIGRRPVQSTTVDSRPTRASPPLRMHGTRPFISSRAADHVVGLGRPDRFADGAATGMPHARKNARATGCAGQRTPTVFKPAVTSGGISTCLGTITVNGPGKKYAISFWADAGMRAATRRISAMDATCTISGLSAGRPFALKIFRTAAASSAFAPNPYTVSVGNAATLPARIMSAATRGDDVTRVFTMRG